MRHVYREAGRDRVVLDAVDLTVSAGQRVALLGPSGCGKSTLLNLIGGIDRPTSGTILFDGQPIARLDEHARTLIRRHRIGFVFQFFNLIPTLTVAENLLLPLELAQVPSTDGRHQRARQRLDRLGLADRAASFPDVLSGGEQQRLAIARALAHEPDLLLADEPTGNLDPETGARVLALLDSVVAETGTTLIMATHSPEAAAMSERILTVADHQLAERAPSAAP